MMWVFILAPILGVLGFLWQRRKGEKNNAAIITAVNSSIVQDIDGVILGDIKPSKLKLSSAQKRRRSAAIAAYVGFNGSAKSATMIRDTLPDLAAGLNVLSTVALLSNEKAESPEAATAAWEKIGVPQMQPSDPLALPHPLWIPFLNFEQMLGFRNGIILMDEVQGIADAREAMGLPAEIRDLLFQLRRNGVVLRWTTIDWSSADKRIRRATQIVSLCRGFLPKFEEGKVWATRSLFWIRTYDARGFDDFTNAVNRVSKDNRPRAIAKEWMRLWGGLKPAILSYSSEAPVLALGASGDSGLCLTCNGKRAPKRCTCADHGGGVKGKRQRPQPPTGGAAAGAEPAADLSPQPGAELDSLGDAALPSRRSLRASLAA